MNADLVEVLGEQPVEFATAGELGSLMARLPADTPVIVSHALRIDPDLARSDEEERTAAAAQAVTMPQIVQVAGQVEQRPIPMVELDAALLRHAADRLAALRTRIGLYLTDKPDQPT